MLGLVVLIPHAGCSRSTSGGVRAGDAATPATPHASTRRDSGRASDLSDRDARHLLGRFSFGVTKQDVEWVKDSEGDDWLETQLNPTAIDDTELELELGQYRHTVLPPAELREAYERHSVRSTTRPGQMPREEKRVDEAKLLTDLQSALLVRQALSNRQLQEVMVDFWFNHFNVYALKRHAVYLVGDYIDRAIRMNALGRFEDLLIATARHPAMLLYLDNYRSNVRSKRAGSTRQRITENYARELLELHTVGLEAHTQRDVIEVARILSGWTIADLHHANYHFVFKSEMHDFDAKTAVGIQYPAGRGEEEGIALLRRLAHHPATARHIATKLCVRFVSYEPSPGCIERTSRVFLEQKGDIRALLRSIVSSPEFWSESARNSKVKSSHAFMVSALRVLGVRLAPGGLMPRWSKRLGQPILLQPVPTGYVEEPATQLSVNDVLGRMNFATALASGQITGASINIPALDGIQDDNRLVATVRDAVFAGAEHEGTLAKIGRRVALEPEQGLKVAVALAMALASPEFQYY